MATALHTRSVGDFEDTLREYEIALRSYVDERPLTSIAAAFAAGYVLGGGLTPRLSWIALNAFGRMALVNVLRDATLGRPRYSSHAAANGG